MPRLLYAAAPCWAGIRHRFRVINHVKKFADFAGYRLCFLWGASNAVAYLRFEQLLSPLPGVQVMNISEQDLMEVDRASQTLPHMQFGGEKFTVYRPGATLTERMFAFDIAAGERLEGLTRSRTQTICAVPAPGIRRIANSYIRDLDLPNRIGIRVRVTECLVDWRKPRRLKREMNHTIQSIIRMPWHERVFIVTDSEYVQRMLASHFPDSRYLQKKFEDKDIGGRYVGRHDQHGMHTFLVEVMCLMACRKIVNIGGFLNQEAVTSRMLAPPYDTMLRERERAG